MMTSKVSLSRTLDISVWVVPFLFLTIAGCRTKTLQASAKPTVDRLFDKDLAFFKRGNPDLKEVALSIDDGPHYQYVPKILETLRKQHVHATFFVVGKKVVESPGIAREMIADGNEIGNHSMTHPRLDTVPLDVVRKEISQCQAAVKKATGRDTTLLRPPGVRYTNAVLRLAKEMGYTTVAAGITTGDYILTGDYSWYRGHAGYQDHVNAMPQRVFKQLKNGGIIDLHDMPATADALDAIIKGIRERGYKIVTVSELLAHLPNPQ
jgi:peptidoglycan/xylan/chitin deacetylase (PgdA/CDA1 family)